MKRLFLLFIIGFSHAHTSAQQSAPPFREMLTASATDSQKLDVYRKIFGFYKNSNSDSIRYFLEQGLEGFKANNYTRGKAALYGMLSGNYSDMGDVNAAQYAANESYKLYTELNDEHGLANIHNSLGVLEGKKGNFDAAVRHFITALPYFEKKRDTGNIINTLIKLGTANTLAGNSTESLNYYEKALALAIRTRPSANRIYLYNNIGTHYAKKHQFDKAIPYLQKALEESEKPEFAHARVASLMNMGNVYAEYENHPKALEYFNKALAIAKATGQKEEETRLLHAIGALEGFEQGETKSLEKALKNATDLGNKPLQVNILQDLSRVAHENKDFEEEVDYLRKLIVLKDSLFNIDKSREMTNLQSKYELGKSNAELKLLKVSEQKNLEKRNHIITIAVILAITLLTLSFFYIRGHKLNAKLLRREQELENANNVKDKLFSIIGHDLRGPIGNIPTLLDIYRSNDTSEEEKQYILNSLEENSQASMETLERLLNWGKLQIKGITLNRTAFYVSDVIDGTLKLFKLAADNKNISIVSNVPPRMQVFADENHFKFIVRNLVSNAIKYTNAGGCIEIGAVAHDDKHVAFSVQDNGIGIDAEKQQHVFEPYNNSTAGTAEELGNSIGLMLCKEFAQQNNGNIWLKSEKGKGSTFYFTVLKHTSPQLQEA